MKRTSIVAAASAAAFLLLSLSCQQFFTTTLAGPLARSSYTVSATMPVDQATALLEGASPELAAALVTPLLAAAKAADPASPAYQAAASALLDAAVTASGVGSALAPALEALTGGGSGDSSTLLAGFDTVTIDDSAEEALILLSKNPPADMEDEEAIAAAAALIADACSDEGTTLTALLENPALVTPELKADESVVAAIAFLKLVAEDSTSPFAGLAGAFDSFE